MLIDSWAFWNPLQIHNLTIIEQNNFFNNNSYTNEGHGQSNLLTYRRVGNRKLRATTLTVICLW